MQEKTLQEAVDIVVSLEDEGLKNEVNAVRRIDPAQQIRVDIFDFYRAAMDSINHDEDLKNIVKTKLIEEIGAGRVKVPQLIHILNSINAGRTANIGVLLDVLKPSKEGVSSPLLNQNAEEQNPVNPDLQKPEVAEAINTLYRLIQVISTKNGE